MTEKEKVVLIWHGLIGHPDEWEKLVDQLKARGYRVFVPDLHNLPSTSQATSKRKTALDLINWLNEYYNSVVLDGWSNTNIDLSIIANSMSTYIVESCLWENELMRNHLTHYSSIWWSGFWVEHGNEDFNKFMIKLTGNPNARWLPSLTTAIKKLMEYSNRRDILKLLYDSYIVRYMLNIYYSVLGKDINDLRNDLMRFWISQAINIPQVDIDEDFLKRTYARLWRFDSNNEWISNDSIWSIAVWLPRKPKDYITTINVLTDLWQDSNVKLQIVGSYSDPMVLPKKFKEMAILAGVTPTWYEQGWHAPHLSPQAWEFNQDIIAFLES